MPIKGLIDREVAEFRDIIVTDNVSHEYGGEIIPCFTDCRQIVMKCIFSTMFLSR
jgi:hypothetical protein